MKSFGQIYCSKVVKKFEWSSALSCNIRILILDKHINFSNATKFSKTKIVILNKLSNVIVKMMMIMTSKKELL